MEYQSSLENETTVFTAIGALSVAILSFLIWLIYFKSGAAPAGEIGWYTSLPALNALLNSLTSIFLITGLIFIKRNRVDWHKYAMLAATLTSAIFLVSYITYHHYHGDTKFVGHGTVRTIYFTVLISHILLSAAQVPLILSTLYLAFSKKFSKHKIIAKITFPIWLYVSVTGVIIFLMLKWYNF